MRNFWIGAPLAALAVLMCSTWAVAQQNGGLKERPRRQNVPATIRGEQPASDRVARDGAGMAVGDQFLIACLKIDNQGEIAAAKMAQQRAANERVKQFAQQMTKEHEQFLEKLQSLSSNRKLPNAQTPRADAAEVKTTGDANARTDAATDVKDREGSGENNRRQFAHRGLNVIQLKQELAQQCLATMQAEFERKSGAEFDRCYMGQQLMAHLLMGDTLKVFSKHASPELRPVLDQALQQTDAHLQEARGIVKELEAGVATTARRDKAKE